MSESDALSTKVHRLYRKILRHVKFVRADRGSGRLAEIDVSSGHSQGYFARILSGEIRRFDVRRLLEMLVALGVDPAGFFSEAFGVCAERYLWELEGRNGHQVEYLKKRLCWAETGGEELTAETLVERVALLEERRMLERDTVQRDAFALWGTLSRCGKDLEMEALRCEILGVLGSDCRTRGSLSSAAYCLREALSLSALLGEGGWQEAAARGRASTLRRVACLASDEGRLEEAETMVEAAQELYLEISDAAGAARTLIDLGSIAGKSGRYDDAVRSFRRGLEALPAEDWRYRFSAQQGLGLCHLQLDDVEQAGEHLDRALAESVRGGAERLTVFPIWLRGRIRRVRGELDAAEKDFREVRRILLKGSGSPTDLALVAFELARVLWQEKKGEELQRLAYEMMPLLGRLERSPLLVAAIEELLLAVLRGELDLEAIESANRKAREGARGQTRLDESDTALD